MQCVQSVLAEVALSFQHLHGYLKGFSNIIWPKLNS